MTGTPGSRQDDRAPAARRDAPVRAVFLVGFMGAGKTSVGRALSRYLGWRFVDLDDRIQAREGSTVPEIFRRFGEAGFRKAELAALGELLKQMQDGRPLIAALGGGAFAQEEVGTLLAGSGGVTVFLDAPSDELWRRCGSDVVDRPLHREESEFRRLYETRRPKYLLASMKIETGGQAVEQIASEIANRLNLNHRAFREEK